ncbi:MAG: hypothetical protein ACKVP2_08165 [Burkholderiales bacterium]
MVKYRVGALVVLVSALLFACSGGGSNPASPGSAGGTTPTGGGTAALVSALALDDDSPAKSVLADLPGGAKMDLYFPQYSVRSSVEVKASSLVDLKLPTGNVAGVVRLEPDGLQLFNTAILTLKVPGNLDPAKTLGFSIHNGQVSYQRVQIRHEGSLTSVDLPITGFSEHGLVTDADPALVALAVSVNAPALAVLNAQLAVLTDISTIRSKLADYFNDHVKPKLELAATLPSVQVNLEAGMRAYIDWRDLLNIMSSLFPGVGSAGIDESVVTPLLYDAVRQGMLHWNERCNATFDPADARRAVLAWLWAPVVYLDRQTGIRKQDLLDMLCVTLELTSIELTQLLNSEQAEPLKIIEGLKVRTEPVRYDTPVRVRVAQVAGGSIGGAPTVTNAQGVATLTATVQGDNPGLAAEFDTSPEGFSGVLDRKVRVFRPRNGGQDKLITGKTFSGTVKEWFLYGGNCGAVPTEGICAGQPECRVDGSQVHLGGTVVIAGDPLAYDIEFVDSGFQPPQGPPVAQTWRYKGTGTFSAVNSSTGFSYNVNGVTTYATDPNGSFLTTHNFGLSIHNTTGILTGRILWPCHRMELEMQPVPPVP